MDDVDTGRVERDGDERAELHSRSRLLEAHADTALTASRGGHTGWVPVTGKVNRFARSRSAGRAVVSVLAPGRAPESIAACFAEPRDVSPDPQPLPDPPADVAARSAPARLRVGPAPAGSPLPQLIGTSRAELNSQGGRLDAGEPGK